ncbi:MAG: DNA translocase FtsK [Eubacteriales bacterium]
MAQTKKKKNSGTRAKSSSASKAKTAAKKNAEPKKSAAKKTDTSARDERAAAFRDEEGFVYQLTPYIISLLALLLAVCIIAGEGKIGGGIRGLLAGLFAGAAYVLPVFIFVRALTWRRDTEDGAFAARTACMGVVYVLLAMLLHILGGGASTMSPAEHFADGQYFVGGGVVGGILGELLVRGFGTVCSLILLFAAMALLVLYIAGMTPRSLCIFIAYKLKVALDNRRERLAERQNPARRDQRKVREEEYLEYLREKRTRERGLQEPPFSADGTELPGIPAAVPPPTVYHVKKRRAEIQPDDQIPDGHLAAPSGDAGAEDHPEETIVAGGHIMENAALSEDFPGKEPLESENAPESVPKDDGAVDTGAVDERIFDEVMRRTRERIEKSRRTEGFRETSVPAPKTVQKETTIVTVDTETGEVVDERPAPPEDVPRDDALPDELFAEDAFSEPDTDTEPEPEEETDSTDTVRLAASVAGTDGDGAYDVSDIFVNPEDAELLDRLSEAYRQNSSASLDVKRGVIATADTHGSPKAKAAVPDYKFPPVELLTEDTSTSDDDIKEELQENARKLVDTLKSFKVNTKIADVSRGPTITRYELFLEPGTKVRSVTSLVDDISLNLATKGVRIEAPIPGKSAVGIEVPNKNQATVHLRTLLCDDRFINAKSKLTVCLGEDVAGEAVYCDIAKMPHLLIAGTTGSGKSVCINSIIMSLLYKASPEDVKMILIDPKKVELNIYNGIPHLLSPVISDPKKAAGSLSWAVSEMERRFSLIEAAGVREINAYNRETKNDPDYEFMNRIVIIIDELADFMMTAPDEVEDSICRIAQKARAAGMHLIIGTQRPSVNVITGLIKANVPSRIAFAVSSQVDSRVIIDKVGAETLIGRGDMLFSPIGAMTPVRVQGAFVSEDDVEKVVSYIKNMNPAMDGTYSEEVQKQIEEEAQKCGAGKKGAPGAVSAASEDDGEGDDPMLKAAIELAVDSGKISTSLIQRRLSLGYGRAAKLIDMMENLGYVSAPDGQKPRKVLITKQQYMEMVLKDDASF